MIDDDQDDRDPIEAAFADHQRAPRDVVPRTVEHTVDDLRQLADGGAQATVTHYDIGPEGITRHVELVTITAPFTHPREENR